MLKFLRKHSKWLLIIFGCFLMVAFTAPQLVTQLGRSAANRTVARVGDASIRLDDLQEASFQLATLGQRVPFVLPQLDERNQALHWLLLTREAQAAGLVGVSADGELWLEDLAQAMAVQQLTLELANQVGERFARQYAQFQWQQLTPEERQERVEDAAGFLRTVPRGQPPQEYYRALSVARGVRRLMLGYQLGAPLSDVRARAQAARIRRQASVETFWIKADDFANAMPQPSEEQLLDHYARFASTPAGEGEFAIGYTLPERVRLEYLALDRAAIEAAITPDPLEVRKRHQLEVRAAEEAGQEPEPFEQARERIADAMRQEIADEVMLSARRAFVAAVADATRALPDQGPYKELPEDFAQTRPSLDELARGVTRTVGLASFPDAAGGKVDLPTPRVVRLDGWQTTEDIASHPELGNAQIRIGSAGLPLSQAVFAVRELRPELGARLAIQAQLPVTDTPAVGRAGNVYFFTVLDARPRSQPDTPMEIRDQLEANWRRLRAYELLEAQADRAADLAARSGLTAAAAAVVAELPGELGVPEVVQVSVTPASVGGGDPALNHEPFRQSAMDAMDALDPLIDVEDQPLADRTFASLIPPSTTLAVGTVRRISPLTEEAYRQSADALDSRIRGDEIAQAVQSGGPFSFEAIVRRLNVELIGEDDSENEEQDQDQDQGQDQDQPQQPEGHADETADQPSGTDGGSGDGPDSGAGGGDGSAGSGEEGGEGGA